MIIFLRKRTLTGIGMAAVVLLSCFFLRGMPPGVVASFAPGGNAPVVVVIDPGHGGEACRRPVPAPGVCEWI